MPAAADGGEKASAAAPKAPRRCSSGRCEPSSAMPVGMTIVADTTVCTGKWITRCCCCGASFGGGAFLLVGEALVFAAVCGCCAAPSLEAAVGVATLAAEAAMGVRSFALAADGESGKSDGALLLTAFFAAGMWLPMFDELVGEKDAARPSDRPLRPNRPAPPPRHAMLPLPPQPLLGVVSTRPASPPCPMLPPPWR